MSPPVSLLIMKEDGVANDGVAFTRRALRRAPSYFLKGPIPLAWLARAGALPGKTLHVGLALWFFANMRRTRVVGVSKGVIARLFGITPSSVKRAIHALEEDRLVTVHRRPGCKSSFELLDVAVRADG